MKNYSIIIFRHGKSDWNAVYGKDHDRPLSKRGINASKKMGIFLKNKDQIPDIVISSSAERAKTTAELAIKAGNWSSNFYINEKIYGRSSDFLLELTKLIDDKHKSICFVGHEPTCSSFISQSTFHSARFKTASMAKINFSLDSWSEVDFGQGILDWLISPKEIS